jgi:hypothetical protein
VDQIEAAFLVVGYRYLKASPGSAAVADDPAEFRLACTPSPGRSAPPPA